VVNESTLPESGFTDLETSKHIEIVPLDLTKVRLFSIDLEFGCSTLSNEAIQYEVMRTHCEVYGYEPAALVTNAARLEKRSLLFLK